MESACQRSTSACGACCGIFNLDLGPEVLANLIRERTSDFDSVIVTEAASISAYRQAREKKEESLSRRDQEVYVCPFFGLPRGRKTAGCMIHPSITGNPHSQNFSFYGASICQAYDCPNKERDANLVYSDAALRIARGDSTVYARLMSDTRFLNLLILIPDFFDRLGQSMKADAVSGIFIDLERLARIRLSSTASYGVTSFEFRKYSEDQAEFDDLFAGCSAADRKLSREIYRSML